jgi:hypothetical protein
MSEMSETTSNVIKELVKRECYWLRQKIASFQGKKYVLFPAGPTTQRFFYTLKEDNGIEAEFFVDNNPALEGKILCGKPIITNPWNKYPDFWSERNYTEG